MGGLLPTREPSHGCPCKVCRNFKTPANQKPCVECSVLGWTKYIPSNRAQKMKVTIIKPRFSFD